MLLIIALLLLWHIQAAWYVWVFVIGYFIVRKYIIPKIPGFFVEHSEWRDGW